MEVLWLVSVKHANALKKVNVYVYGRLFASPWIHTFYEHPRPAGWSGEVEVGGERGEPKLSLHYEAVLTRTFSQFHFL